MVVALTDTYDDIFETPVEFGRYFSSTEFDYGANKVVIGHHLAEELFGTINPNGKIIKLMGRKFEIIGVLEKSGESLLGIMNNDDLIMIPYEMGRKVANLRDDSPFGSTVLSVKAKDGVDVEELKDELTGILRAHRRVFDAFFGVLNTIGLVIGGFAILVGMFSVANIMFVSVKERTNIIGIKKALGAKRYVILLEFLIEAVILSIIGGGVGLFLIFLIVYSLSQADFFAYDIYLSMSNVMSGIIWSTIVGILAGIIPALQASGMDPVVAIRSK